jgi:hypothetical protein
MPEWEKKFQTLYNEIGSLLADETIDDFKW